MQISFLTRDCPARREVETHIAEVFHASYGARVSSFAPLLVSARRGDGPILAAAGIRTSYDGFFSQCYLDHELPNEVSAACGIPVPATEIMEVVSLAATTPFPVLPMLDHIADWGRTKGMTCGLFTATGPLRRLLGRTGMSCISLAKATPERVPSPQEWGSYYDTDPEVCVFSESLSRPHTLSPRRAPHLTQAEAS